MEVKSWGGKCKGVFIVAFFLEVLVKKGKGCFFEATIHKRVVVVVWRVWMMCFFFRIGSLEKGNSVLSRATFFFLSSCDIIFIFAMPLNVGVS